jgi:hypothetical protein
LAYRLPQSFSRWTKRMRAALERTQPDAPTAQSDVNEAATSDPADRAEMPYDPNFDPADESLYEQRQEEDLARARGEWDDNPGEEDGYGDPEAWVEEDPTPPEYYEWLSDHPDYEDHATDDAAESQEPDDIPPSPAKNGRTGAEPPPPQSSGLRAWSGEDFLARTFPPKEPLATGLLNRRGLITLGARRRNGKTTFVTDLAVAGNAAIYRLRNPIHVAYPTAHLGG